MRIQAIAIAVLLSLSVTQAQAQGTPMTLAGAVAKSLELAPAGRAASAALRAADAGVDVANARPNPTVTYENENVAGSGRYAGFGNGERTLSLSVPVELGGKRTARRQVAEAERSVASIGVASARAEIVQRATEAFLAVAAAQRRLAVAQDSLELADRTSHAAHERVSVGKASPIEEQRAGVVRINAEVKLGKSQRALALARADLARLTGSAQDSPISADWFDRLGPASRTEETLNSLSLAAADAQLAVASARVANARSERVPDVTLTAGVRRFGDSSDRAAVLGISVPLPLFNRGTAALTRSTAEYDRALAERAGAVQEVSQALAHAEAELKDALAIAAAANGPALAAAQEVARIARLGYENGKFPQLELIDAERSLAESREAAIEALAASHIAKARLARLQGSTQPIYKD